MPPVAMKTQHVSNTGEIEDVLFRPTEGYNLVLETVHHIIYIYIYIYMTLQEKM